MSTAVSGVNSKVFTGLIDMDVIGGSFDYGTEDIDTTTTADNGWADSIAGIKSVTGSFDFFWNPAKTPYTSVTGLAPGASATVFPTLKLYIDADNFLMGVARIQKLSCKKTVKDGVIMTATFVSKGQWQLPA
jgi:hypothetical protein